MATQADDLSIRRISPGPTDRLQSLHCESAESDSAFCLLESSSGPISSSRPTLLPSCSGLASRSVASG